MVILVCSQMEGKGVSKKLMGTGNLVRLYQVKIHLNNV